MKTATYQNELIVLEHLDRAEYQKIYTAAKNGQLNCPICGKKVSMYLGIHSAPYFFHHHSPEINCGEPAFALDKVEKKEEYVEREGFHLPKGRSITTIQKVDDFFKPAVKIGTQGSFVKADTLDIPNYTGYIQHLADYGVTLDKSQMTAVTTTKGSLLVLAGAGSGKTRVLTVRTAYMLESENIDPRKIMLVTFTSKAAAEMKKRLLSYPGIGKEKVNQMVSGTFHSIFYRILMFHYPKEWSANNLLKKEWQREKILKEAGKELGISEKEFAYDLALQQIGFWKNSLLTPSKVRPGSEFEEKAASLYQKYEQFKQKEGLFDFDDMLLGCYELFTNSPSLLEQYQERFSYFLIDEFQDINKVQYELIKLFSGKHKNVCAVGDDDQAIYSFRGSDPSYLLDFESDFPNAKIVTLEQNYRSSHEIVSIANHVIKANKVRRPKQMKAQFSSDEAPLLFFPYDEEEEATMIVSDLKEQIALGASPSDFAVLYRTNAGSRALFERLASSNLPFKIDLDAEAFYDRYIVRSVLAFLKISLNEDDLQAITDILPFVFLKQSALRDLKAISILEDCSLLESMAYLKTTHSFQEKKLKKAVLTIKGLKTSTPLAAIEMVEKEIGFLDFLKKRGNESNKLEKGSDDLKDLKVAVKGFDTIDTFLAHADHMSAMNKEIKNLSKHFTESITLSTIHRSKGLEYKTVYVIGAVDGSLPHDFALESYRNGDPSGLEEERRLFYVALTRAKEKLYISVPQNRRGRKANRSRFLAQLYSKRQ
jgi:DNA helicase-2/ATP-dependent DNA helicase PcrA